MAETPMDLERLAELIRLVETRGLTELVVEENGCTYEIRGTGALETPVEWDRSRHEATGARRESSGDDERIVVEAPMVGVFFRSPSPGEAPYVNVGDLVEEGQIIGLIEAMKVFSEVPCDHAGVVDEISARDGDLVRPGQPLLYLKPGPEPTDEGEHELHD
jgi:acetyl-CoA carboxylase biotin carboxyl carrier protein